jgi:PKD repeat protein
VRDGRALSSDTVLVWVGQRIEPDATFTFEAAATDPYTITFQAEKAGTWDFGDGANGTGSSPTHRYAAPGNYTVGFEQTATAGTATHQETVTIMEPKSRDVVTAEASGTGWLLPTLGLGSLLAILAGAGILFVVRRRKQGSQ